MKFSSVEATDLLTIWIDPEEPKFPDIMTPLQESLCSELQTHGPFLYTQIACVADKLSITEDDIREAIDGLLQFGTIAQVTVRRQGSKAVEIIAGKHSKRLLLTEDEVKAFRRGQYPKPVIVTN